MMQVPAFSAVMPRAGSMEPVPDAFWKSLGLFNLSRMVLASVLLAAILIYRDGRVFGASNPKLFYQTVIVYFCLSLCFWWGLRKVRTVFEAHLVLQAITDIVVVSVLLHASGGIRSGLGILLLMPLAAAASVSRGRMSMFFAALATCALLVENTYWVFQYEIGFSDYLPSGLMGAGCFVVSLVTNRLARRLVANEQLVRLRSADLQNQLEINRLVIRDMPTGVLAVDYDGKIRFANPEAERLVGRSSVGGSSLREIAPTLQLAGEHWRASRGNARTSVHLAGREVQVRLLDATGADQGDCLIFLEDANRLREQAQQLKLAALGRLTANIAHEIRNPLSAINHAAELLQEEASEGTARLTRIITENAARLDRIVNEVLQLNRRDRAVQEQIRLAEYLRSFIEHICGSENISPEAFVLHLQAESEVLFDKQHLHQILWNLVTNAWRHSTKSLACIHFAILHRPGHILELHIVDDGPGIGGDLSSQVFEPFFTTESRGTGLGLYIARELSTANRALLEFVPSTDRSSELEFFAGRSGANFRLTFEEYNSASSAEVANEK